MGRANDCIDQHLTRGKKPKKIDYLRDHVELVIVDEVERLSTARRYRNASRRDGDLDVASGQRRRTRNRGRPD
jgi:hypothetical protein